MIMKTINFKKVFTATALLLTVGYASAFTPEIRVSGDNKIELKIGNVSETTQLVIKDLNGFTFYTETISKSIDGYSKVFDLTVLPDGKYEVEIDGSVKIVSFPINIVDDKIAATGINKLETYKPIIYEKGSKVYVSKFNLDNKPLSITILNSDNAVVYEETLKGKADSGRVYKFLKSGDYQISMISNDKTYNKTVSIQK